MAGTSKERDQWQAAVAVCLYGSEVLLRADKIDAGEYVWEINVPCLDWKDISIEYKSGKISVDAKRLVESFGFVEYTKRVAQPTWRATRDLVRA